MVGLAGTQVARFLRYDDIFIGATGLPLNSPFSGTILKIVSEVLTKWLPPFAAMRAVVSSAAGAFIQWLRGYSGEHWRVGLQTLIAFSAVAALILPAPVWNALYYAKVDPVITLAFMALVFPAHVGGATIDGLFLIAAFIIGGALVAVANWAAWAANGSSFVDSVTKGAVFVTMLSTFLGIVNMLRWRWDFTNPLFTMVAVSGVFSGSVSTYHLSYLAWEAPFYALALGCIAAAAVVIVSWTILPITSGTKYRQHLAAALRSLAEAVAQVQEMAVGESGANQDEENQNDIRSQNSVFVSERETVVLHDRALKAARRSLLACRALEAPVRMEVDLYHKPRIFPR